MQVIFGRRLAVFGTTKLEEIITRHWICWCNYMHNILPNINYRPRFVISRVDALYVPTTGSLSMSDEYSIKKKTFETNTLFSHFKDNTLHTFQNSERKTHKQTKALAQVMDLFIDGS
jgi:hypothetical protein